MYFNLQNCNVIKKKIWYKQQTSQRLFTCWNECHKLLHQNALKSSYVKGTVHSKKWKFCYHVLFVLTAGHYNLLLYEKELCKAYSKCLALA